MILKLRANKNWGFIVVSQLFRTKCKFFIIKSLSTFVKAWVYMGGYIYMFRSATCVYTSSILLMIVHNCFLRYIMLSRTSFSLFLVFVLRPPFLILNLTYFLPQTKFKHSLFWKGLQYSCVISSPWFCYTF